VKALGPADPRVIASYQLLGVLGSGGMARVYLARSTAGRKLAIKVIRTDLAAHPLLRQRFAHEVAALRRVNPLFTAPIVDADPDAPEPWLATTFIDGPSLDAWVTAHGPLEPAAVLTLAAGLAEALASIHRAGLVHRDLKPGNVLLDDSGPHIIDFGVALLDDATRLTVSLVGTPAYMAPERLRGEDGTPEADVFSLGATLAYAATGRGLVGDGTVYAQVMQIAEGRIDLSAVPGQLRSLIAWCLSRRPRDRPSAAQLTRLLADSGVRAPGPGWYRAGVAGSAPTVARPRRAVLTRRRLLLAGGLCVAAAGAGLGVTTNLFAGQPSDASTGRPVGRGGPGSILWQLRSGARPAGSEPWPGDRILVLPPARVVAVGPTQVCGLDTHGNQAWHRPVSTGTVACWRWGDGVLVADGTGLSLLDAQGGGVRFAATVPAPVQSVAVLADRAFLDAGTGLLAVDRGGRRLWQAPTLGTAMGMAGPRDSVALTADAGHLLIQERYGDEIRVGLADPDSGELRWTAGFQVPPPSPPPGPPGDGPPGGGPPGGGPPGDGGGGQGGGGQGDPPPPPPPVEARSRIEARLTSQLALLRSVQDLRAVRLSSHELVWQRVVEKPVAGIELAGGALVVAADEVTAREVGTGKQTWNKALRGARVAVTPDARAILAATDRALTRLDGTGGIHWQVPFPAAVGDTIPDRLTTDGSAAYVTFRERFEGDQSTVDVLAFTLDGGAD
jgi:predicted Ser/Thr protein kinase